MTASARTEHPAILRAQEIHSSRNEDGSLRTLTDAEVTFLASVDLITMRRAKYVGDAVKQWGDLSVGYWCVVRLADAKQHDDLTHALEVYDASVDAQDEVDEIELAEAEQIKAAFIALGERLFADQIEHDRDHERALKRETV